MEQPFAWAPLSERGLPVDVVMLLFPRLTQLDLTGPFEVLSRYPELRLHLVWKALGPVADAAGLQLLATAKFADAPQADILFVPGGPGQVDLMDDAEVLAFLRTQGAGARFVTSVCTGSLVLAAAGLLRGYRATSHWLSIDQLAYFGAIPTPSRVVEDGNRITGAGVTSGIDFALTLMTRIFGAERGQRVQLLMEYDPQAPEGGSLRSADASTIAACTTMTQSFQARRDAISRAAAARLLA
jgi:cyclohexyl-isocyanide hydratase